MTPAERVKLLDMKVRMLWTLLSKLLYASVAKECLAECVVDQEDGPFYDIALPPPAPPEVLDSIIQGYDLVEPEGRRGLFYNTQGQYHRRRQKCSLRERWEAMVSH